MSVQYEESQHRWIVTGVSDANKEPVTVVAKAIRDTVYVEKCTGGVVKVSGKVNAVTINNVNGVGVLVDDVIAVVEVINSKKTQVQVNGAVSTVIVDKSSSVTIFASEHFKKNGKVLTSNSSSINLTVPDGDDFKEFGLAEQISHTFKDGHVVSEVSKDHVGV
jgi:adenylyl cyclase-associated protein